MKKLLGSIGAVLVALLVGRAFVSLTTPSGTVAPSSSSSLPAPACQRVDALTMECTIVIPAPPSVSADALRAQLLGTACSGFDPRTDSPNAVEMLRLVAPGGRTAYAEFQITGSECMQ